jgi:hypothetical protein
MFYTIEQTQQCVIMKSCIVCIIIWHIICKGCKITWHINMLLYEIYHTWVSNLLPKCCYTIRGMLPNVFIFYHGIDQSTFSRKLHVGIKIRVEVGFV